MPIAMERALKKSGKKKGLSGKRLNAYIYGTLQRVTNWKPGKK